MSMQSGAYRDMSVPRPGKNLVLAYILWFILGWLGVHRFYVGHVLKGVLFIIGTLSATALTSANALDSDSKAPVAFTILGAVIAFIVLVFWVIDAFKLPKLVAATGKQVAAKSNE